MIMSTELQTMGAHAPGLVEIAAQNVRARIFNVIECVIAHRQARARYEVRAILASLSDERLAAYGWHPEEIDRLKSH